MTDLRQAAQQMLKALDTWMWINAYSGLEVSKHNTPVVDDARHALREALAAQQEPVAVVRWNDIGHISWRTDVMLPDDTPLYTAPPAPQPLTDEQIEDLYFDGFSISKLKEFARAIERAHNIGGVK